MKNETPKKTEETPRQVTPVRRLPRVETAVKAGPTRRMEDYGDFIGNYN